jgi:hypothetical protein
MRTTVMPVQGFGIYVRLLKQGHTSQLMGLKGKDGDVARWNSRVKLARNFRGLHIIDCSDKTLKGYNALFQVFLTHSALERYLEIIDMKDDHLEPLLQPYSPDKTIKEFFDHDKKGKLFEFLSRRLTPRLRSKLTACRDGTCTNVCCLSASVRHIFAHGHLTAHSYGMNPNQVFAACNAVSEFLLDFMDSDFTMRVGDYDRGLAAKPRAVKDP